jgi:Na+-driven multidrug efflux pump
MCVFVTKFVGVAVGSGWQALVAYVNVGSYYIIGVPVGVLLGWIFSLGVLVRSIQAVRNTFSIFFEIHVKCAHSLTHLYL